MEETVQFTDLSAASSLDTAKEIVRVLHKKLARDIKLIYAADMTVLTEYYVVCHGRSSTHVRALAADLEDELCKCARPLRRVEGVAGGEWVLVDFGDVIVHVFSKDAREFYRFERLFKDEAFLPVDEIIPASEEEA